MPAVSCGAVGRTAAGRVTVLVMLVCWAGGCGPELTTPSSTNISGAWFSSNTARGVTDFSLELFQAPDGALTGTWPARGVEVDGQCSEELGCAPANDIVGSNTVFQVLIDLIGAGAFTGQVEGPSEFRGHLADGELTFHRVPSVQGALSPRGSP